MSPALWEEFLCSCAGISVCSEGEKASCCFSLMSWDWRSLVFLCDHLLCLSWRWMRWHGRVFQILPSSSEQRARTLLPLGIKWVSSHGVVNLNPAEHWLVPEWKEWQGHPSVEHLQGKAVFTAPKASSPSSAPVPSVMVCNKSPCSKAQTLLKPTGLCGEKPVSGGSSKENASAEGCVCWRAETLVYIVAYNTWSKCLPSPWMMMPLHN